MQQLLTDTRARAGERVEGITEGFREYEASANRHAQASVEAARLQHKHFTTKYKHLREEFVAVKCALNFKTSRAHRAWT